MELDSPKDTSASDQVPAFTSFYTPGAGAKPYGANAVDLDIQRLMTDVQTGALKGVDVRSPEKLTQVLTEDIAKIHDGVNIEQALKGDVSEYVKSLEGLSPSKAKQLENRLRALQNTQRDREWLIKGVIPKDYLTPYTP